MEFKLTDEQAKKAEEWMNRKRGAGGEGGAIGGRFTYEFTPTTIGTIQKVKDCLDGDVIDLTEYGAF